MYLVLQQKLFLDLVKKTMTTQPNNNNATVMAKTMNGDQLMGIATAKAEAGVAARGGGGLSGGGQRSSDSGGGGGSSLAAVRGQRRQLQRRRL
jgi:hypothetical protein